MGRNEFEAKEQKGDKGIVLSLVGLMKCIMTENKACTNHKSVLLCAKINAFLRRNSIHKPDESRKLHSNMDLQHIAMVMPSNALGATCYKIAPDNVLFILLQHVSNISLRICNKSKP